MSTRTKNQIYLDYQGSTPADRRVIDAMVPWLISNPANPHASHEMGIAAATAIAEAQSSIESLVGAESGSVVFTSGATESINLGVLGALSNFSQVVTWETEHSCTLDIVDRLKHDDDVVVTVLSTGQDGLVDLEGLNSALSKKPAIVSIALVNNEIGVIQDIRSISSICRTNNSILHVDGAQAVGKIRLNVTSDGIDLLSFSGHKMYGPRGIGALVVSKEMLNKLDPILCGAGQQDQLRPGTLPTPLCVGLGVACEIANQEIEHDLQHATNCQVSFLSKLNDLGISYFINGSMEERWPGNLSITLPGVDAGILLARLPDLAISSGSACSSGAIGPSLVLQAIGLTYEEANSTLRIGFGRMSTLDEVGRAAERIATETNKLLMDTPVRVAN